MTDILLAVLALTGLGTFLVLIAWRVPQTPLLIIFSLVFLMAAYDFWRDLRRRKGSRDR